MGNIGEAISPAIPTVGSTGAQYATDVNAILGEVVARLTAKVPLSSLVTGTDFSLGGARLTDAGGVVFANQAATPAGSPFNRAASFAGDLHWVSPSGTVKITSGGTLNSAAIGGITGDYGGADPAQFRYDTANDRYDAYADFGVGTWADVRGRALSIAAGATSLVHARLMFAGGANKTYTLPPAASTSQDRPVFMDTTGQIKVGHGTQRFSVSPMGMRGSGTTVNGVTYKHTAGDFQLALGPLPTGVVLASVVIRLKKVDATALTLEVRRNVDGVATVLASQVTNVIGLQTVTLAPADLVGDNTSYALVSNTGAVANDEVYAINFLTTMAA